MLSGKLRWSFASLVILLSLALSAAAVGTTGSAPFTVPAVFGSNYRWHTFYGGPEWSDWAKGVATDDSGNIYVAGESRSWLGDGNASPRHANPTIFNHATVLKLSPNGVYRWHTFYGPTTSGAVLQGIDMDDAANVYVAGGASATWLGDSGQTPLHAFSGTSGDAMIFKLDTDGDYVWHTFYGTSGSSSVVAYDIAVDDDANVYVTGTSGGTWNGAGGALPLDAYAAGDVFVLKLSPEGAYEWHTFVGPFDSTALYGSYEPGIAVDADDHVYIHGYAPSSWLGPDGRLPLHAHSTGGNADIGVLSLTTDGAYRWHTFYGPAVGGIERAIAADLGSPAGIYLTGLSNAWLGDGGAQPRHANSGGADVFVLKLDGDGAYQWHTYYGPTTSDEGPTGYDIAVGQGGREVYVSGESRWAWNGDGNALPLRAWPHEYAAFALKLSASGAYRWHSFYPKWGGYSLALGAGDALYLAGGDFSCWNGDGGRPPLHACNTASDLTVVGLMPLNTAYVDAAADCGGQEPCYTTLGDALATLGPGDTLYIYPGTYAESLDLSAMALPGDLHVITVDATGTPTPGTATIAPPSGPAVSTSTRLPGDLSIDGLIVVAASDDGINVAVDGDISISNVIANDCSGDGLELDAGGRVTIENSTANGNGESGLQVVAGEDMLISRVTARDNGQAGIEVAAAGGAVTVLDCWLSGNDGEGLTLGDVDGAGTLRGSIVCGNGTGLEVTTAIAAMAEANWWGCAGGPGTTGCDTIVAGPATVDAAPWIAAIDGSATIDPVIVGRPAAIHFQFSGGSGTVFLGQGPGDPNCDAPFTVSTNNGVIVASTGTGASVGEFVNQPNGVLEAMLVAGRGGTATVTLAGPCGLHESTAVDAAHGVYLPLVLRNR